MSRNSETFTPIEQNQRRDNNSDIVPLPPERKAQLIEETKDQLNLLNDDLQKISHEKFLAEVPFSQRLKYITDPNIDSTEVKTSTKIEFNFSFTGEKANRNLYLLTTAGQVLPQTVSTVTTSDGKQYSRSSLSGEFFAEDGKRLIIHDKTQITIGETRTQEQIVQLEKKAEESLQGVEGVTDENKELFSLSASKGIDPKLVLGLFSAFFGTSEFGKVASGDYEDFLTQVDREIGYMNMDKNRADKHNLSQEAQDELVNRMGNQTSMDSIDYSMPDFPELQSLATECGIRKPEFLYAIWELESSCGQNVATRQESRGRESLGMFQILNVNLPDELAYELKNNPSDKDINIRALRHFIQNNSDLVVAINNSDFESIASIYNGRDYDGFARRNGWTPYDDKLRNSVTKYYDRTQNKIAA